MSEHDGPTTVDMTARSLAPIYQTQPDLTDDIFDRIREGWDHRARDRYTKDDVYYYRLIPSGNGVDSYYTRAMEDSLSRYTHDLSSGQAVLGNHDTRSFSYGSSFGGSVEDADPTRPEYEATFYRDHADRKGLSTTRWIIGEYYMVRGVELNGQRTDDLIRAVEMGAVRRSSITFTVGEYRCSIDGVAFEDWGWFGMFPNEDAGCSHFPGLDYKIDKSDDDRVLCVADMYGNQLLETSFVYRNASPSAMLLRRAETMARAGMFEPAQAVSIEERFRVRLPAFERRVHARGKLEVPPVKGQRDADPGDGTAPEDETPIEESAERVIVEDVEVTEEVIVEEVTEEVTEDEAADRTIARLEGRNALLATRQAALDDALGQEATPEAIRALNARAVIGDTLLTQRIDEVVKEKIRALGAESFDSQKYRQMLLTQRDLSFIEEEAATWKQVKAESLKGGRQVKPAAVPTDAEPKAQPVARTAAKSANMLERVGGRKAASGATSPEKE